MKSSFVLATSWVMSQPGRLQAVVVASLVLIGLIGGLSQPGIAEAGPATGTGH